MIAYLDTGEGPLLALRPGRRLAARVVRVGGGRATVSVAGVLLEVDASARLVPGSTVRLVVAGLDDGRVALRLVDEGAARVRAPGLDLTA